MKFTIATVLALTVTASAVSVDAGLIKRQCIDKDFKSLSTPIVLY